MIGGTFLMISETCYGKKFRQMCNIWRTSKSKLTTLVRSTNDKAELLSLKPSNIQSVTAWNNWVKNRKTAAFKEISDKYRKMRKEQIPQTSSRKGFVRLAHDMKKKSSNPKEVTRSKIWLAGHTHADGRPVRPEFAETIEKIKSVDSEIGSSSTTNLKEDAVSQVLGKDRPGRIRGLGRGVTATKLAFLLARDSHMVKLESQLQELQNVVIGLTGKQSQEGAKSEASAVSKGVRCQILDWCSIDDVFVGEGEFCSADPMYKISRIPIGPNAMAIIVKDVSVETASLWRPTETVSLLSGAVGVKISWPSNKIVLDTDTGSETVKKNAKYSPDSQASLGKIFITGWNMADTVVAEGRLCSTDPKELFNNIPIGPLAAIVTIDKVINRAAPLWRPSEKMAIMADALNEHITWPLQNVHDLVISPRDEYSSEKRISPPRSISNSTGSTSKSVKKKCILLACNNSGEIVAEGRVFSTNPTDTVHHAPLGPNASSVLVEVMHVGNAKVWRATSEFQTIADALGSTLAWPNDKLMYA